MKTKMFMLATIAMTFAFTACNQDNGPQKPPYPIDGQWSKGRTYFDINHQLPNTVLMGDWDDDLKCPYAEEVDSIQSIIYSDDQKSCLITNTQGETYTFTNLSADSCDYVYGMFTFTYGHPSSPFVFKTVRDLDTVTAVEWKVRYYVNDTLLTYFNYEVVDSTKAGIATFTSSLETFDYNGVDSAAWRQIQALRGQSFTTSQIKVITATPSIKTGEHNFYLKVTRNSTSSAGLSSASVISGMWAKTDEVVSPASGQKSIRCYSAHSQDKVDELFSQLPSAYKGIWGKLTFTMKKLK